MADMVTKQELEAAKIDVKHAGEAVNTKKVITPRYGAPFKSLPLVAAEAQAKADEVVAQGFYRGYTTEALLLAAKPAVSEMRARADDTRKIYRWNRTSAEGVTPVTGSWVNTGLSDKDLAAADATTKANAAESNAKTYTDTEIAERIDQVSNSNYSYAAIDSGGKIALAIKNDGTTEVTNLEAQSILATQVDASVITTNGLNIADSVTEKTESSDLLYAITDINGNIALSVNKSGVVAIPQLLQSNGSGAVKTLRIGSDDSIMHIGDSMTASHYCLQNKSYISQLSQLSPFRHINYGVSSEEAIGMQKRVLQDTQVFRSSIKDSKPKYLFITS